MTNCINNTYYKEEILASYLSIKFYIFILASWLPYQFKNIGIKTFKVILTE